MADQVDAVLTRVVAEEVAPAPAAPSAGDIATYLKTGATRRSRLRPVLAVAAVVALLLVGVAAFGQRDNPAVVDTPRSKQPAYLLPGWPKDLTVRAANSSTPGGTEVGPTVHVFQRVNSDPNAHQVIVVAIGAGHVAPSEPAWDQRDGGDGSLTFTLGDVPLIAYTRSTDITETDVRRFAAGLKANGASAGDGLDPDSGGGFATVNVFSSGGRVAAPPFTTARWSNANGTVTISTTTPPSGITDTVALPAPGVLRTVNGLSFLDSETAETRTANWLDASHTWVTVVVDGSTNLDHVIASMYPATESDWKAATGRS